MHRYAAGLMLQVSAAIVTCGGLCPGLNDVIQSIVHKLVDYGVEEDNILGIQYGMRGFYDPAIRPVTLSKESVDAIHLQGGTVLVSAHVYREDHIALCMKTNSFAMHIQNRVPLC